MEIVKLEKVAKFINGYAFKPSGWSNAGMKIIRIQNLTDTTKPFNRTQEKVDSKYVVKKGDILVSWSATLDVFEWQDEDALLNQHIFKVEFNEKIIDKYYFKYVLKNSIDAMKQFTHGSTMKHIVRKDFLNHEIPLPSIEEQKCIVRELDAADALRQKRKQAMTLLDDYLKAVFLEIFGDPVMNPKGWGKDKFGNIGTLDRGISKHRPRNAPELLGGNHPLIQTGDVANAGMFIKDFHATYSDSGLSQSKKWAKGTLCITIAANIAKTGILTFDACFPDSVAGFIPNPKKTNNVFMHFWMSFFQKILEMNAPESAQKNINLKTLRDLDVIVPPIELQNKFAEIVEKVELMNGKMTHQGFQFEANFNALMQRAFNQT